MCGSGLVDAVAELVKAGLLDRSGRLRRSPTRPPRSRPRWPTASWRWRAASASSCCTGGARRRRRAAPSTSPSATCASCSSPRPSIATGWTLLLRGARHRARATSSRCCWPARSAPTCRPASAVRIGLVPKLPVVRIVSAGNVAGEGAKMALLSLQERAAADGAAGGGRVRRAVRPRRLQRPLRRAARAAGIASASCSSRRRVSAPGGRCASRSRRRRTRPCGPRPRPRGRPPCRPSPRACTDVAPVARSKVMSPSAVICPSGSR